MNIEEIQSLILRYLEAMDCHILEKNPAYITVKLSPEADKDLTNRPYYWSFVERCGVEPETLTMKWVFDPANLDSGKQPPQPATAPATGPNPNSDSILGRYFGHVPTPVIARVPTDEVTYGSRRLEQIFASVRNKGRFVQLFEESESVRSGIAPSRGYEPWLNINVKVELACDMKRSEIHSLGINLSTGAIRENFFESMLGRKLTPRLPADVHVNRSQYSLEKAVYLAEEYLLGKLQAYDHSWSHEAHARLEEELQLVHGYYDSLLKETEDPEEKLAITEQWNHRRHELEWQYSPRVNAFVINSGLFHLNGIPPQ